MRTIITLVASIAILGASPAPADADLWKKVATVVTKPVVKVVKEAGRATESIGKEAGRAGRKIDEEVFQPMKDAAEKLGRKWCEEVENDILGKRERRPDGTSTKQDCDEKSGFGVGWDSENGVTIGIGTDPTPRIPINSPSENNGSDPPQIDLNVDVLPPGANGRRPANVSIPGSRPVITRNSATPNVGTLINMGLWFLELGIRENEARKLSAALSEVAMKHPMGKTVKVFTLFRGSEFRGVTTHDDGFLIDPLVHRQLEYNVQGMNLRRAYEQGYTCFSNGSSLDCVPPATPLRDDVCPKPLSPSAPPMPRDPDWVGDGRRIACAR